MPDWLPNLIVRAVLVVVMIAFLAAIILLARQLRGPWWPTVIFQHHQRPSATGRPLWGSLAVVIVVAGLAGGPAYMMGAMMLWTIVAPRHVVRYASRRAWRADKAIEDRAQAAATSATSATPTPPDTETSIVDNRPIRLRAAEVRNRIRERLEQPFIVDTEPWDEYIMDAVRADRQKAYQDSFDERDPA